MASELSYYLLQFFSASSLNFTVLAFFVAFLIWEIPRLSRMIEQETLKGLYPEGGRVVDLVLLLLGIGSFLLLQANLHELAVLAKNSLLNLVLGAGLIALPVIIVLGFLGRAFSRLDSDKGTSAFIVQTILDLDHTVFHICFVGLVFPAATLLFSSFL